MSEPILPSSNTINLRRLNGLRVIVLAAELLVAALALYRWHLSLPVAPMSGLFTAVVVLAVLTALRLRWSRAVTDPELFLHLTLEVVALTVPSRGFANGRLTVSKPPKM